MRTEPVFVMKVNIPRCKKCGHFAERSGADHDDCEALIKSLPEIDEKELSRVIRSLSWRNGTLAKMVAKAMKKDLIDAKIFKKMFPEIWEKNNLKYGKCEKCGKRMPLKYNLCSLCR